MLKDVFDFAENLRKTTYGLGYKKTLTRNEDEGVLDKAAGFADAGKRIDRVFIAKYPITVRPFNNKIFNINKFSLGHPRSSDILKDPFL